jgi:hypothetical protein
MKHRHALCGCVPRSKMAATYKVAELKDPVSTTDKFLGKRMWKMKFRFLASL